MHHHPAIATSPALPFSASAIPTHPRLRAGTADLIPEEVPLPAIREPLLGHLRPRLQAGVLRYIEEPRPIPHNWEAYIFRFQLAAEGVQPPAFADPLVLRLYATAQGGPRAQREFAAQRHLRPLGYGVANPLLLEPTCAPLGGPFLIMEMIPGGTLLERLRRHPYFILSIAASLARLHLRLHALPPECFPAPSGRFLDRRLDELRALTGAHQLDGLAPGVAWLYSHRPSEPSAASILHLDFHPANVMVPPGGPPVVLDWNEADVGDRHADVATTLMLMQTVPVETTAWHEPLLEPFARWFLVHRYLRLYQRQCPLDAGKLRYYLAWAILRRLGIYGMWLRSGPGSNGCKPCSLHRVRPAHVADLAERFRHCTGVAVHLR
jgi:aminoglycoside phosphotransferase (APT) family kinase protein